MERHEWWRWAVAIIVMLLLVGTIVVLSLEALLGTQGPLNEFANSQAVRGLLGLVLLFCLYAIYQQNLIRGTRTDLADALAMLDSLTGLYSRHFAEQQVAIEVDRSQRYGYPLTVMMLDIKDLKWINDSYGKKAGDLALRQFASEIKKRIRSCDLPARVGGDEFLVILTECCPEAVPRVLMRLGTPEVSVNGYKIAMSFSAGWTGPQPHELPDQLIQRAQQLLENNRRSATVEEQIRREQAQERQLSKMQAVGRLSGGIAHDFNNFLNVILGYSELLLEDHRLADPQRERAKQIKEAGTRASSLIRQLLAFARKQFLIAEVLDINAVVTEMQPMLQSLLGEDIEFVFRPGKDLGHVRADVIQVEQVILNLLANARDAMPQGGTLVVKTENVDLDEDFVRRHLGARSGPHVLMAVADTGVGMDAETQKLIFEPFFTTREKGKGTGLGLSTVYGIVKQSGGYISVDSELGRGTTFSIYLPRVDEEAPPKTSEKIPTATLKGWETVLLVENEHPVRRLAREFLEKYGYRVLEAADGEDALQLVQEYGGTIHLLLTDVVMPGMNGPELAKRLSAQRPEMKILYTSGFTESAVIRQGLTNQTASFLQKPFSQDAITHKVRTVLDQ